VVVEVVVVLGGISWWQVVRRRAAQLGRVAGHWRCLLLLLLLVLQLLLNHALFHQLVLVLGFMVWMCLVPQRVVQLAEGGVAVTPTLL
jgi:hypothetical protein